MADESTMIALKDGTSVTLSRIDGQIVIRLDTPDAQDIPLIYTERGNVPYDSLAHEVEWEFGDRHVSCALVAKHGDHLVRREPHIFLLEGLAMGGQTQRLDS